METWYDIYFDVIFLGYDNDKGYYTLEFNTHKDSHCCFDCVDTSGRYVYLGEF